MNIRTDALLFGETAGRIVASCQRYHVERVEHLAARHKVAMAVVGRVGGARLRFDPWLEVPVDELNEAWRSALPKALGAVG